MLQGSDEDMERPPHGSGPRNRPPYKSRRGRRRSRRGRQSRPRADSGAPRGKRDDGDVPNKSDAADDYESKSDEPGNTHENNSDNVNVSPSSNQLSSGSGEPTAQTNEGYSNENSSEQGSDEDMERPPRGSGPRNRPPYKSRRGRRRSRRGRQSRPRADSGAPRGKRDDGDVRNKSDAADDYESKSDEPGNTHENNSDNVNVSPSSNQLSSGSGEPTAQTNEGYSNENSSEQIMDNESQDHEVNIDLLPNEMLIHVFQYLSHNKLGEIARVCRRWNEITKSPVLWKDVIVALHKSPVSQTTVALSVAEKFPTIVNSLKLSFVLSSDARRDWTTLDYEELIRTLKDRCPNLQRLTIENAKLTPSLPSIIELSSEFSPHLNSLKFFNSRFSNCSVRQFNASSKIEALSLPFCQLDNFNNPPFSRMPCLQKLSLSRTKWAGTLYNDASFFEQLSVLYIGNRISAMIVRDIKQHAINLKELYLCVSDVSDSFFQESSFAHLETICLRFSHNVTVMGIVTLIQSAPCLKNIYVLPEMADLCRQHPFLVKNNCSEIMKCSVSYNCHVFE